MEEKERRETRGEWVVITICGRVAVILEQGTYEKILEFKADLAD